jgi:hypothetical protein
MEEIKKKMNLPEREIKRFEERVIFGQNEIFSLSQMNRYVLCVQTSRAKEVTVWLRNAAGELKPVWLLPSNYWLRPK